MKKIISFSILIIWAGVILAQQVIPVVQTGHSGKIRVINWDDSGRYLASADDNNDVVINDVVAGKQFYKVKLPGKTGISDLKFEGNKLLIANKGKFYSFDMLTLKLSEGASSFSTASDDGGYKIRGTAVKKGMKSLINKDVYVHFTHIAEHPSLPLVIAGDERGWLYFCNKSLNIKKKEHTHRLDITDIDYSNDGRYVAIASAD
ncbi:MAG: hypothetical protein KA793_06165, partial [Bacteroidales bacterium]|nr:hypothetical protein [Bacteroidales bacterium]